MLTIKMIKILQKIKTVEIILKKTNKLLLIIYCTQMIMINQMDL